MLVANPTAQSGKAADWIRHARALLDEASVPHRFVATEPEGATIDRVREAIDDGGARVVIYMGGDGTFAEVAKGILGVAARRARSRWACCRPAPRTIRASRSGSMPAPGALERNVAVVADG